MKKSINLLWHALLLIFLINMGACHKNDNASFYISFLANGSRINYTTNTVCILNANDSLHNYSADFIADNSTGTSRIFVGVISSIPLTTSSVYLDTVNLSGPPVTITFYPSGLLGANPATLSSGFLFPNHVTLKLTAITSTYVAGTFSGNIASAYNAPVTKITNGSFHLQVK